MWPDRVSSPGPLTYESGALPTALRGPALTHSREIETLHFSMENTRDIVKEIDGDNEPSSFQEMLVYSTKQCVKDYQ